MANGNSNAKETLYHEAEKHAKNMENGGASTPRDVGKALAFLIRALKPFFLADFVTVDVLEEQLEVKLTDCRRNHRGMGWPTAAVIITITISVISLIVKLVHL